MRNFLLSASAGVVTAVSGAAIGGLLTLSVLGSVEATEQGPINNVYPLVDEPAEQATQPEPLTAERLSELMPPPASDVPVEADWYCYDVAGMTEWSCYGTAMPDHGEPEFVGPREAIQSASGGK